MNCKKQSHSDNKRSISFSIQFNILLRIDFKSSASLTTMSVRSVACEFRFFDSSGLGCHFPRSFILRSFHEVPRRRNLFPNYYFQPKIGGAIFTPKIFLMPKNFFFCQKAFFTTKNYRHPSLRYRIQILD